MGRRTRADEEGRCAEAAHYDRRLDRVALAGRRVQLRRDERRHLGQ